MLEQFRFQPILDNENIERLERQWFYYFQNSDFLEQ